MKKIFSESRLRQYEPFGYSLMRFIGRLGLVAWLLFFVYSLTLYGLKFPIFELFEYALGLVMFLSLAFAGRGKEKKKINYLSVYYFVGGLLGIGVFYGVGMESKIILVALISLLASTAILGFLDFRRNHNNRNIQPVAGGDATR